MPMRTSLSKVDPVAREGQVLGFLDSVPRKVKPVLIGGYAVAAYGPPRFSVDVDLIFPVAALEYTRKWLRMEGVDSKETWRPAGARPPWVKLLIERDLLSGDLYFGGLRARDTGALIDYEWLALRPTATRLALTTGISGAEFPVARAEAIWVLKLLAGRPQDVTDLFAIFQWPVNLTEVGEKLKQLRDKRVEVGLKRLSNRLLSDKEYQDALSRRSLGSPANARNLSLWSKFKSDVISVLRF